MEGIHVESGVYINTRAGLSLQNRPPLRSIPTTRGGGGGGGQLPLAYTSPGIYADGIGINADVPPVQVMQ